MKTNGQRLVPGVIIQTAKDQKLAPKDKGYPASPAHDVNALPDPSLLQTPSRNKRQRENYPGPPRRIALQLPSATALPTASSTLSSTTSTSTVRTIPPRSNSSSTPKGSGPPAEISTPGRPTLGVSGRGDSPEEGLPAVHRERAVTGREGVSGRRYAAERFSGLLLGPSMTNIGRVSGDEAAESDSRSRGPVVVGGAPRGRMLAAIIARFCVRTSEMVARRTAPFKFPRGPVLETWYVRSTERVPHLETVSRGPWL